ncbi:aspartate/glutamate racemase family protein [Streptomyces roseolilacinus]|uniref:Aspartate racemase n=1 Tax=Streptomyces roseolilacinus TaxID=66904 RepID=A0A918B1Q3_9ACTN|nr:amino acid racemase [Streptomyces roseolilacinus]GGQ00806.1 aspartate racemase [Streptomyces roseolilacinus]
MSIGILGGMGPLATVDFYRKVIDATPAGIDQEHLPVVVWADPTVPDRSAALSGRGPDPTPWLVRGAHRLEAMGARLIATPCNTAHAFLDEVRTSVRVPMLDMIAETVAEIRSDHPDVVSVGLLATTGTVRAGLYQRALEAAGLRVVVPGGLTQGEAVTGAIRRVKAGDLGAAGACLIERASEELAARGAGLLVAGCTELPLLLGERSAGLPVVDPTAALARATVREALARPAPV